MTSVNRILDSLSGTEIAIIGMACRFPGAKNPDEFWNNLRNGIESIVQFNDDQLRAAGVEESLLQRPNYVKAGAPLDDMEMFDAAFFGLGPRDAAIMDPQHRHFLEVAWEALENAGYDPRRFPGSIGVYGGSGMNAYLPYNLLTNPQLIESVGFFLVRHTGNDKDFLTTRVSYAFDLKGPSVNVQTACSTSLVAIHLAGQSLLNGECDMALAGGVTIELPHRQGYIYHENEILSPDGHCRAFDANSKGTVFGSGAGIVVLRRLADALENGDTIHAVIKGSAVNNDGAGKVNYLAPGVDGQAQAIIEALNMADVSADTIAYVETHGTGTQLGDPIEIAALTQAFRASTAKSGYCGIGSVKTNIGHLDTAAGVASLIKVVQALKYQEIPPSLNFVSSNPIIDFDNSPFYVNNKLDDWKSQGVPRRAGVSSLGVGGTNAHIVLEEAPDRQSSGASRQWQLLTFSAKTERALDNITRNFANRLRDDPGINLADAAYTLHVGRQAFDRRRIIVSDSKEDAIRVIEQSDRKHIHTRTIGNASPSVVFMFPGGGAQYPNMGRDIYESETIYRESVDTCLRLLRRHLDINLKDLLYPDTQNLDDAIQQMEKTSIALPALFITEYALAKLWMSWGIEPKAFIGHSLGEYTAACLAGVMSLEDALYVVNLRGRLFKTLPHGEMLSVPLSESELQPFVKNGLSIAALNSPSLSVLSGDSYSIETIERTLASQGIEARRLKIAVAAHSAMLEPILDSFHEGLRKVKLSPPQLPYITNVTGTWIKPEDATDPRYWVQHLRNTVRFADGVGELLKDSNSILLEVGPGNTLSSLVKHQSTSQAVLTSLRHPQEQVSDEQFILTSVGKLWLSGIDINWSEFHAEEQRYRIPLPTYPFDHQRYWIEPGKPNFHPKSDESQLSKQKNLDDWFYRPVWKKSKPTQIDDISKFRWLIFVDECGLGLHTKKHLEANGHSVTSVKIGNEYQKLAADSFAIDPRSKDHYSELIADLVESNHLPHKILHLWGVTNDEPTGIRTELYEKYRDTIFYSLLFLTQTLGAEQLPRPIHIGVVSNGMQEVEGEGLAYPEKAILLGPTRVIPQEYSDIACQSIDIQLPKGGWLGRFGNTNEHLLQLVRQIIGETVSSSENTVVAYRGPDRWIQEIEKARLTSNPSSRIRDGGVYLITGGLGGIGLALAEYLSKTSQPKLVLVSHTGLPPREVWSSLLDSSKTPNKISDQIRQILALEANGAEISIVEADITHRQQVLNLVDQTIQRFGSIQGVIHAAGVLNDNLIQLKSMGEVERVLSPKVRGVLLIDEVLKAKRIKPDFVVLFSSTSTLLGSAGQVDYVGANAFLDAFAHSKTGGTYTVAINWGVWREVGMAVRAASRKDNAAHHEEAISVPITHPLLQRKIRDTQEEIIYRAKYDAHREWVLNEHRLKDGTALLPGTGYLEIARAAVATGASTEGVEICDLVFMSPLVVPDNQPLSVDVALTRSVQDYAFSVMSLNESGDWIEHTTGHIASLTPGFEPAYYSIDEIVNRCNVSEITFHDRARNTRQDNYLNFGPRWDVIRNIKFGLTEAIALLELPHQFAGDLQQYRLHPGVMDIATSFALPLIHGYEKSGYLYVPLSYQKLRAYGTLPAKIYSHVLYKHASSQSDEVAIFDVTIMDENGKVVIEINEFMMRRMDGIGQLRPGPVLSLSNPPVGREGTSSQSKLLDLTLSQGISPDEGRQIFSRILAANAQPQIYASPLDLPALIQYAQTSKVTNTDESGIKLTRPDLQNDYLAPRNNVESALVKIWEEILGVDRVGIRDNFFELGGQSLIAVRLFNRIRKLYSVDLSLSTLFQTPTVEQLAELIGHNIPEQSALNRYERKTRSRSWSSLVEITPADNRRLPFFCIHDLNGHVLYYRDLVRHLGPNQPFYGLQAHGTDGKSPFDKTVVEMAARYLPEIRAAQPKGPYLIGGSSLGGLIAFEIARQLKEMGEEIALLALFDTWSPDYLKKLSSPSHQELPLSAKMARHWDRVRVGGIHYLGERFRSRVGWARYKVESMRLKLMRIGTKIYLRFEQPMPDFLRQFHMEKIYAQAYRNYAPQHYSGNITLFRATERPAGDDFDPELGWGEIAAGGVEIFNSPGPHGLMVRDPHAQVLAEQLKNCIDRATERKRITQEAAVIRHESR